MGKNLIKLLKVDPSAFKATRLANEAKAAKFQSMLENTVKQNFTEIHNLNSDQFVKKGFSSIIEKK